MIELLRNEIRTRYPAFASSNGPALLQIGGTNWRGGRIHFAALGTDGSPALFARTTRNPVDEPLLRHEHELLAALAASTAFHEHVCAPAFFARVGGRDVLCERAARGRPMPAGRFPWKSSRRFAREMDVACDVAIALARATAADTAAADLDRFTLEPLVRFWVDAGNEPDALGWIVERLHAVLGARARTVVVHGDFIPKNLLVGPGTCVVVDWETAEPHGLPLLDLVYFVTRCAYVGAVAPGRKKAQAVRAFYASQSAHAYVARSALQRYCTALGLAPGLIDPVFRLHFLHKAMLKARTTSLDNPVTQLWLDMFRERLDPQNGPWPALAGAVAR